jgi:hypothetical protein
VEIGGSGIEQAVEQGGGEQQADEPENAEGQVVRPHRRSAQPVIDQPAERQSREADGDRRGRAERRLGRIDQEALGADIIDQHQQREAADPGEIGFPFEPVEPLGHPGRRDRVLLVVIEAAAMDRPQLARGVAVGRPGQMIVEPDEIEGRPDPGDARGQMEPPDREVKPFGDVDAHPVSCRDR